MAVSIQFDIFTSLLLIQTICSESFGALLLIFLSFFLLQLGFRPDFRFARLIYSEIELDLIVGLCKIWKKRSLGNCVLWVGG